MELFSDINIKTKNLKNATNKNVNTLEDANTQLQQNKINLKQIAIVYCTPVNLFGTNGTTYLPILTKKQQPIGQLKGKLFYIYNKFI